MGIRLNRVVFMIVDDNMYMRQLVRRVLRGLGVSTIREALDGSEALTKMRDEVPDVLVTDWVMDPMDGIELTRYIRKSPESPNPYMPIIMMTGFAERTRVFTARDVGVNEFLVKPVSAQTLFSRISAVIERPRQFVRIGDFFGPDRRRKKDEFSGDDRRGKEPRPVGQPAPQAAMTQTEINDLFNPT
jgi:CheY-like chemotaxis protein